MKRKVGVFLGFAFMCMNAEAVKAFTFGGSNWVDITNVRHQDLSTKELNKLKAYPPSRSLKKFDFKDLLSRYSKFPPYVSFVKRFNKNPQAANQPPAGLFVYIHGTFSRGSSSSVDPLHPNQLAIARFAQYLMQKYNLDSIEVASLQWSSFNNTNARKEASAALEELIAYYRNLNPAIKIFAFGHSHGGNVINLATTKTKFDEIIFSSVPSRETGQSEYDPTMSNVGTLYNFYSTGDPIQFVGAKRLKFGIPKIDGSRKFKGDVEKIFNVRVQVGGSSTAHTEKILVLKILPEAHKLLENFVIYHDLDMNIEPQDSQLWIAIRHLTPVEKYIDKTTKTILPAHKEQEDKEKVISKENEKKYLEKYSKSIHKKEAWFKKIKI